jgi:hypothetical protein
LEDTGLSFTDQPKPQYLTLFYLPSVTRHRPRFIFVSRPETKDVPLLQQRAAEAAHRPRLETDPFVSLFLFSSFLPIIIIIIIVIIHENSRDTSGGLIPESPVAPAP